jgi:hypothetical protein
MMHFRKPFTSISRTLNHVVAGVLFNQRILNGNFKSMGKIKAFFSRDRSISSRYYILPLILWWFGLAGCTSLKKAGLISGASLAAASVTSVFSSGVTAPLLAGASTAFVTSVTADQMLSSPTTGKGGSMPTAASCAPDNFWTLLGDLVSMGGWLLILVIVIPMILGWLLPGPLERAKKKRK